MKESNKKNCTILANGVVIQAQTLVHVDTHKKNNMVDWQCAVFSVRDEISGFFLWGRTSFPHPREQVGGTEDHVNDNGVGGQSL